MNQQQFKKINDSIISFLSRNAEMLFHRVSKDSTAKNLFKQIEGNVKKLEGNLKKSI